MFENFRSSVFIDFDFSILTNKKGEKMAENNIETGIHYSPIHKMTFYRSKTKLPITEYVGEHIVNRYLPTLSTDMIHSNRVIEVSEEDSLENKRLDTEWFSTTRHMPNWDGEVDGSKEKWNEYFQHNKMLEKKYLPGKLECHLGLLKINDMVEFKKGLQDSLWNCDMCSYNIEPENIKIENDMVSGFTISASNVRVFVGANGPYWLDSNSDVTCL